ncbi:MAG: sigma 54-interacting transcriptional regulator [Ignavibacteriae bacterium]|nr:sigma 54-interacting transcriptional regulator [Ignavibacteriota bacterium]
MREDLKNTRKKFQIDSLKFEKLLSMLSARFINVPAQNVDNEINESLKQICNYLCLDLASLWQINRENPDEAVLTHYYRIPDGPVVPDKWEAKKAFPWTLEQMIKKKECVYSNPSELPPEAHIEMESRRYLGLLSHVTFPLYTCDGPVIGVLTFNTIREEVEWSQEVVNKLRFVSQVFVNALDRKRTDEILWVSEERLRLAASSAGAGFWDLIVSTGQLWVNEGTRNLYGFRTDECIILKDFFNRIHTDDRKSVERDIQNSIHTGTYNNEHRILLPDGQIRWISGRAAFYYNSEKKTERLLGISIDITHSKTTQISLEKALADVKKLKKQLQKDNIYLKEEIKFQTNFEHILGHSDAIKYCLFGVEKVAPLKTTVLIYGETGTGKELIARAIHSASSRKDRPLIKVDCSSLPQSIIESELFGHEKGAYTDAKSKSTGRFELADGSTLFLDEISELPLEAQSKLLRITQYGEFERLGSSKTHKMDVRLIAATNRNLEEEVKKGRFREDLFFRLNVFRITVPPLRERKEDIPEMVLQFVKNMNRKLGKKIEYISQSTLNQLKAHTWPGNVRELENLIEYSVITSAGNELEINLAPRTETYKETENVNNLPLAKMEKEYIIKVLEKTNWKIEGPGSASGILKLAPSTLRDRMKKMKIRRK